MTTAAPHSSDRDVSRSSLPEHPAVVGVVAAMLVGGIAFARGFMDVMHRPLWLDEIVTHLAARSPHGVIRAIQGGDFEPPLLPALIRAASVFVDAPAAAIDRLPSALAALGAVALLAAALRARRSLAAALVGALALAGHPLFFAQAAEARPYALWIFGSVVLAISTRARTRYAPWLVAAAAVLLLNTHYFAALSLGAVAVGIALDRDLLAAGRRTAVIRRVVPLGAGVLALLLLVPLARAQLAATGGKNWMSPASMADVRYFMQFAWAWRPVLAVCVVTALALLARRAVPAVRSWFPVSLPLDIAERAQLALALVPLFVVGVELTYKPVIALRYSAPAAVGVAVACALLVDLLPTLVRWGLVLWFARAAAFTVGSASEQARDDAARYAAETQAIERLAQAGVPAASVSRHDAYRLSVGRAPAQSVAWTVLDDTTLTRVAATAPSDNLQHFLAVERDFGRATAKEFAFPVTLTSAQLRALPAVAIIRDAGLAAADTVLRPGTHLVCRLSSRIVVYSLSAASPTPAICAAQSR